MAITFIIEILKLNGGDPPKVLITFSHSAHSIERVRDTMKSIQNSPEWPAGANGYRIVSSAGTEVHRLI